jgi:hypothetical protein
MIVHPSGDGVRGSEHTLHHIIASPRQCRSLWGKPRISFSGPSRRARGSERLRAVCDRYLDTTVSAGIRDLSPIATEVAYAVALHEIGHIESGYCRSRGYCARSKAAREARYEATTLIAGVAFFASVTLPFAQQARHTP